MFVRNEELIVKKLNNRVSKWSIWPSKEIVKINTFKNVILAKKVKKLRKLIEAWVIESKRNLKKDKRKIELLFKVGKLLIDNFLTKAGGI